MDSVFWECFLTDWMGGWVGGGLPSSESVHAKIIYCGVAFLFDAMHWCILVTGKDKKIGNWFLDSYLFHDDDKDLRWRNQRCRRFGFRRRKDALVHFLQIRKEWKQKRIKKEKISSVCDGSIDWQLVWLTSMLRTFVDDSTCLDAVQNLFQIDGAVSSVIMLADPVKGK